ncbi:TSCPD domain-containing protein [Pseudofrankia inefficax]|uniref:ribonucleoside-diphosphate reductase n=1 Tax=Pseudofrankia inefficax (strain DSM 45817 / CECT 9037 / DDB 130130 / EuI1c) TaxID=298654 RepID=E3J9W4_PSEI1|nr:ribonucleoside-diphosphate reductase [Pseudofrankia inefficax]ADP78526.1 ribonucleoside-diphosphate reductase, adenosylcobalamin-dependent [Pseudofrankia inefficax]
MVTGTQERHIARQRAAVTRSFTVGGAQGYLLTSRCSDGTPADLRLIMGRPGTTLHGLLDTVAVAISTGLQTGIPLATFVRRFADTRFEPAGLTDDPEIPEVTSVVDYVVRRLALDYLTLEDRVPLDVLTPLERAATRPRHAGPVGWRAGRS